MKFINKDAIVAITQVLDLESSAAVYLPYKSRWKYEPGWFLKERPRGWYYKDLKKWKWVKKRISEKKLLETYERLEIKDKKLYYKPHLKIYLSSGDTSFLVFETKELLLEYMEKEFSSLPLLKVDQL